MSEAAVWLRAEAEHARELAAEDVKVAESNEEMAARRRTSAANWLRKAEEMLQAAALIESAAAGSDAASARPGVPGYVLTICGALIGTEVCTLTPGHERSHLSRSGRQW